MTVSQQINNHDCVVGIYRYTYNMYLMRNRLFTKLDIDTHFKFISDSTELKFTGDDIKRIRQQLHELVQTMSILYKERLQSDSIEVVNIDEGNKTIVKNEVMIGTEEAISNDN